MAGKGKKAKGTVSARTAAVEALRGKRNGLPTKEIIDAVLDTKGVSLTGKTPGATINAMLAVEAKKPDGIVVRTKNAGEFKLRPTPKARRGRGVAPRPCLTHRSLPTR